jgi:hypothetical protein
VIVVVMVVLASGMISTRTYGAGPVWVACAVVVAGGRLIDVEMARTSETTIITEKMTPATINETLRSLPGEVVSAKSPLTQGHLAL